MKAKGKSRNYKLNKGKFISRLAMLLIALLMINMYVSFAKYIEQYLPTLKYHLESDLAKGNQDAIDYYNNTYVANGKQLFGDRYITKK